MWSLGNKRPVLQLYYNKYQFANMTYDVFCTEKQNYVRSNSPVRYVESPRANGHFHGHKRNQVESSYSKTYESFRRDYQDSVEERQRTPSPPIRRRSKEQVGTFFLRYAIFFFSEDNIKCAFNLYSTILLTSILFFFVYMYNS